MANLELGSHLCTIVNYFWPKGGRFRQVPLYLTISFILASSSAKFYLINDVSVKYKYHENFQVYDIYRE